MPIVHSFVSAKSDGGDTSLVRPSDWNADHDGSVIDDYDEWVNRSGTTSLNGLITFTNCNRTASGGPSTGGGSNGAYLVSTSGGSVTTMASVSSLNEGDLMLFSMWVITASGGGTFLYTRMNADGTTFVLPHRSTAENAGTQLPGSWTFISWSEPVGADGTWVLASKFNGAIADLRIRRILR